MELPRLGTAFHCYKGVWYRRKDGRERNAIAVLWVSRYAVRVQPNSGNKIRVSSAKVVAMYTAFGYRLPVGTRGFSPVRRSSPCTYEVGKTTKVRAINRDAQEDCGAGINACLTAYHAWGWCYYRTGVKTHDGHNPERKFPVLVKTPKKPAAARKKPK